jgi:hypothetical protein
MSSPLQSVIPSETIAPTTQQQQPQHEAVWNPHYVWSANEYSTRGSFADLRSKWIERMAANSKRPLFNRQHRRRRLTRRWATQIRRQPKSSSSLFAVFGNIFSQPAPASFTRRKRRRRRKNSKKRLLLAQESKPAAYLVAKTTPTPSVVFFPTNKDKGCGSASATGSGFNTFGFMAMMLAAFNAVNLVASNNNNRRNNNNNNNNDNNDNNNQVNEGNTMGDIDNPMNMIILPPVTGRNLYDKLVVKRATGSGFHLDDDDDDDKMNSSTTTTGMLYTAFTDILLAGVRFQVLVQIHGTSHV